MSKENLETIGITCSFLLGMVDKLSKGEKKYNERQYD